MEEEVSTILSIWMKRFQQYYQYGRRGFNNIINMEEEVSTTLNTFFLPHLKMFKGEGFFCERRRGCKNIINMEEEVREYLKYGRGGCKNILSMEEEVARIP